jgi:hypothetical protein
VSELTLHLLPTPHAPHHPITSTYNMHLMITSNIFQQNSNEIPTRRVVREVGYESGDAGAG